MCRAVPGVNSHGDSSVRDESRFGIGFSSIFFVKHHPHTYPPVFGTDERFREAFVRKMECLKVNRLSGVLHRFDDGIKCSALRRKPDARLFNVGDVCRNRRSHDGGTGRSYYVTKHLRSSLQLSINRR